MLFPDTGAIEMVLNVFFNLLLRVPLCLKIQHLLRSLFLDNKTRVKHLMEKAHRHRCFPSLTKILLSRSCRKINFQVLNR